MIDIGEEEATEAEIMDAACDIVPLLANAMTQPDFAVLFADLLPLLRNRIVCFIYRL